MRRQLWETIVDLAEAVLPLGEASGAVRVTAMELDLPLEIVLNTSRQSVSLVAELPRWRLSTGFEPPRSRLRMTLHEVREDA